MAPGSYSQAVMFVLFLGEKRVRLALRLGRTGPARLSNLLDRYHAVLSGQGVRFEATIPAQWQANGCSDE